MAVLSDITAGTISVANGSPTVTGVGTAWQIQGFKEGDFFLAIGAQLVAVILSVNSNTSITLTKSWEGATLSGAPYRLRYQADGERVTAKAQQLIDSLTDGFLSDLVDIVPSPNTILGIDGSNNTVLIPRTDLIQGVQVDAEVETLAERATYDGQPTGFSVLVANVGDGRSAIYFKLSNTPGDWSDPAFLTGPSGTVVQSGPYNPATAYVVGNIVLQNGSSWVARVNTTGNAPPTLPTTSNTQWFLLAAAGNGFVFRGVYSGATAYVKDDVVFNQNSSWIALVSTTGNAPPTLPTTSNTQWQALAVRGAGDVSGPSASVLDGLPTFADLTGKVLKDSGTRLNMLGFRNQIINGDFEVYQAAELNGFASANIASSFPLLDRWKYVFNGTGANRQAVRMSHTLGQTDVPGSPRYFMRIVQNVAGTGATFNVLVHAMEDVTRLAGKKYTLTFYAKFAATTNISLNMAQSFGTGGSPSAQVNLVLGGGPVSVGTTWQKCQYVFTLGGMTGKTLGTNEDNYTRLEMTFPNNATYTFDMSHVSMVEGDATAEADPFTPRSIETEMVLCRRFIQTLNVPVAFGVAMTGWMPSTTLARFSWPLSKMYKTPTLISLGAWIVAASGGSLGTVTPILGSGASPTQAHIEPTLPGTGIGAQGCSLQTSVANSMLIFDAGL